jgi:hypothetical protein
MLDVAPKEEPSEESIPDEETREMDDGPIQSEEVHMVKRRRPEYFDKRQQVELVLAAQELSELGDHELSPTTFDDEEDRAIKLSCADIWEDPNYLMLLMEGVLPDAVNLKEAKRIRKRASNYCWKEQKLFFKALLVPEPKERLPLVKRMHEDLGHFGEYRTLTEIRCRYFWHN